MTARRLLKVLIVLAVLHAVGHTAMHYHLGCRGDELTTCPAHTSPWAWRK